ncbi:MAG: hypothetical protein RIQ56_333 [Candidatus Parcubacteria bacterium]
MAWGDKKDDVGQSAQASLEQLIAAAQVRATALGKELGDESRYQVRRVDTVEEGAVAAGHKAAVAALEAKVRAHEATIEAMRVTHAAEIAALKESETKWRDMAGNLERQLEAARKPPEIHNHFDPALTFALADLSGDVPRFFGQKGTDVAAFTADLLSAWRAKAQPHVALRSGGHGNGSMALRPTPSGEDHDPASQT